MNGTTHTFDSFECAIYTLAPTCENCGIRIIGHGLEKDGTFFCCEHCAEAIGVTGLRDRVGAAAPAEAVNWLTMGVVIFRRATRKRNVGSASV